MMSDKPEWEQQLNLYACMARRVHGRNVTSLKIIAILRDWQRKQAELKPDYPACQVATVDIPVWPESVQEEYLLGRVKLHQAAKEEVDNNRSPTYCSDSDRWLRGELWAVMKEGRKSAVKLYDNKEDAIAAVEELGAATGLNPGHYVEHRPGNYVRCAGNYCLVSAYCKQWTDEQAQPVGGTGEGTG
jgi:hypothetical protein